MESLYIPILTAAAVALFIWGAASALRGFFDGEKRKLQNRLHDDPSPKRRGGTASQLPLSITRESNDAIGASALLARWSPLESLHRMVVQAFPSMTLAPFMCIAGLSATSMFVMGMILTGNGVIALVAAALGAYFP